MPPYTEVRTWDNCHERRTVALGSFAVRPKTPLPDRRTSVDQTINQAPPTHPARTPRNRRVSFSEPVAFSEPPQRQRFLSGTQSQQEPAKACKYQRFPSVTPSPIQSGIWREPPPALEELAARLAAASVARMEERYVPVEAQLLRSITDIRHLSQHLRQEASARARAILPNPRDRRFSLPHFNHQLRA